MRAAGCGRACGPVLRPRLRGRTAGLKGISGGFAAAASPRMVCSRLRASFAVLRDTSSAGGQLVLPDGDFLAGERVQLPDAPVRQDEPADPVLAVRRGAGADILRGLPAVDPFADRDLTCRRIGPCARADLRLLVAAPGERGLLRLEARLAGFAAGDLVLHAPRSGPLPRFSAYAMSALTSWG